MKIKIYWFVPILLFILQALYTFNSLNQIRYEELAESVRNVYWLEFRTLYDGQSTNVGWYGLALVFYKLFGFSLFLGKFVRLGLSLASLICLAAILRRYLAPFWAGVLLITIGLSPTLLYFNTIQAQYGIDLQYLPICLYLLLTINFRKRYSSLIKLFLLGFISMLAWMSYPTFIYYLASLLILFFYLFKKQIGYKSLISLLAGFFLPLLAAFIYVQNRQLLIYDPIVKSGIFRGAGVFDLNLGLFLQNFKLNLINLFNHAFGYNFEINKVEFSDIYPIISILFIIFITIRLWMKVKKVRIVIASCLTVLLINVFLAYFSVDPTPGLRRTTGILAAIYTLFGLSIYYLSMLSRKEYLFKYAGFLLLSLVLMHHLIVYPINLLHLKDRSIFTADDVWFRKAQNPNQFLDQALKTIQNQDISLICEDKNKKPIKCRYSEVFAAIKGSCLWNNIYCHRILGYDLKSKQLIPLVKDLWDSYYFEH